MATPNDSLSLPSSSPQRSKRYTSSPWWLQTRRGCSSMLGRFLYRAFLGLDRDRGKGAAGIPSSCVSSGLVSGSGVLPCRRRRRRRGPVAASVGWEGGGSIFFSSSSSSSSSLSVTPAYEQTVCQPAATSRQENVHEQGRQYSFVPSFLRLSFLFLLSCALVNSLFLSLSVSSGSMLLPSTTGSLHIHMIPRCTEMIFRRR